MDKKTLTSLFAEALYQIPDYQRGYAWEEKQWKDFIQDIDALVEDDVRSHYTGTVVVYSGRDAERRNYGTRRVKVMDVVDGQQRLTTSCLSLSVILRELVKQGETEYERDISDFLYSGTTCKLTLNNDTADIFLDLLKSGRATTPPRTSHAQRLVDACNRFQSHIATQLTKRGDAGLDYLRDLHNAITQNLQFTFYTIEEECEIGMTFELMNSRGKELSVLELLKNYLMHWVSRNESDESQRKSLTHLINKDWKDTYTNIGASSGSENQCLRIAWTLYCSHTPKNWQGYNGFKDDNYIPLRNFNRRSKADTKGFIVTFADGLAEVSRLYAAVNSPTQQNRLSKEELLWLTKIHHSGNIANFLPLMVAARKQCEDGKATLAEYIDLLKALECYAYRVFLFSSRRSNAGISNFSRWGNEVFNGTQTVAKVIPFVHWLTRWYSPEPDFVAANSKVGNWYKTRNRLRYTLFEYELHLLETEGQGKEPTLRWENLSDSTVEHILPQSPAQASHWMTTWTEAQRKENLHDIGNLVLTQDNSSYRNFDFTRKAGTPGQSPSYANSDIRQERRLARFADWTPAEFEQRRQELATWINQRWCTAFSEEATAADDIVDDDDEVAEVAE